MSLTKGLLKVISKNVPFISRANHVWSNKIVRSPFDDVQIPEVTFPEYMWQGLDKWSDKTATVCGITDRSYTYTELHRQTNTFAANLRKKLGLRDGDTVAVMLPNMPEYPTAVLGVFSAGGIVTTVNPVYTSYELNHQFENSDTKFVITNPETLPTVKQALNQLKRDIKIICISNDQVPSGTISFFELANDINVDTSVLNEVNRKPEDVCLICYSSGTTGLPKGVELTHRNLVANCQQQTTESRQHDYTTDTYQDTLLAVMPMFHSYGLSTVTLQKLASGLKAVVLPKFKPDTFLNAILKYRVSILYAAPPMVLYLGSSLDVTSRHLESLNSLMCGAAPIATPDIEMLYTKAKPNMNFVHGFGMTEASPLVTVCPRGYRNYASVGFALPNSRLRVVDAQLNSLGPNEMGELLISGPNVMKGYKNNPEANKTAFTEDGWLRSGDQVRIDETGAVFVADRLKELIKVKGFQVPPAELEQVLKQHSDVLDAAVVGAPDAATGERPLAFVVLHTGKQKDKDGIIEFVKERVAPYKRISDVIFLESIPKNSTGKILRRVLKEEYCK